MPLPLGSFLSLTLPLRKNKSGTFDISDASFQTPLGKTDLVSLGTPQVTDLYRRGKKRYPGCLSIHLLLRKTEFDTLGTLNVSYRLFSKRISFLWWWNQAFYIPHSIGHFRHLGGFHFIGWVTQAFYISQKKTELGTSETSDASSCRFPKR